MRGAAMRGAATRLILALTLGMAAASGAAAQQGRKVLLVVRSEGASLPIDEKVREHLEQRGYRVTLHSQYGPVDAAKGMDLVLLSSTIRGRDLLGAYRDVAVPLLTWESDLLDDLAMSGKRGGVDYGTVDKARYVWLVNAPEPMAAGQHAGVVDVYQKQARMNWGKPGLGARTIATIYGEPDKVAIFGYERGATMDYESVAPARRVMFFLDNETFTNLSPAGMQLFDAAVDWAAAGR